MEQTINHSEENNNQNIEQTINMQYAEMEMPEPTSPSPKCNCDTPDPNTKKHCCCTALLICNIVLFLGLIGIYVCHFAGIGTQNGKVNPNATVPIKSEGGLKIAYVDSDSLLAKYDYARKLEKDLLAYKNQQEANYQTQMAQFQKDYQDYLQNGDKLSLSQQQAKEAELKKRAERLSTLEAELSNSVIEKQLAENTKLLNAIFGFIKEYNEANQQYDVILRKTLNDSPTLYVNPGMDITQEIIDGLNKEYAELEKK